jgi:NtrC-family two-component system response regulator AlgB
MVVLMTAYATVQGAVAAMKAGAYDYLVKPFALDEVAALLERVLELRRLRQENRALRDAVRGTPWLESASPGMQRVIATARRVAESDATVLLSGESGTGKNVLAAAIHDWSRRHDKPFVTIACTTLAEHLLESELFGHVKGAFTGAWRDSPGRVAAAAGGTVFLDEVGELPPELQAKLLRFLEDHAFERVGDDRTVSIDARVIAATNRDLDAEVAAHGFRQDLYFRLNVVAIPLPPLRERIADLDALVDRLLATLAVRHRRAVVDVSPEARAAMHAYRWPGNIRELQNALERAVVLSRDGIVRAEDLPDRMFAPSAAPPEGRLSLEELERRHISQVLAESTTLEEAAARLGINPTTLWRKRRRYGLD